MIKILGAISAMSVVGVFCYVIGRFNGYMDGMSDSAMSRNSKPNSMVYRAIEKGSGVSR